MQTQTIASVVALLAAVCSGDLPPPHGLRVEHLGAGAGGELLGVDTANPRLSWLLPGTAKGQAQAAFQARVDHHVPGAAAAPVVVWDSGTAASATTVVTVAGPLAPNTHYQAVVRWLSTTSEATAAAATDPVWSAWSAPFNFSTGPFAEADWAGTVWLAGQAGRTHSLKDSLKVGRMVAMGVSQLRASFVLTKPVATARLHVAGTGWHRCWINGQPVSDLQLGHHTTSEARVLYDSFDVTVLLVAGGGNNNNAIGCQLAPGWYGASQGAQRSGAKAIRLLLSIVHPDGTRSFAGSTNASAWSWTASPYTTAGIFEGIVYDQRMAIEGWRLPGYTPAAPLWQPVSEFDASGLGPLSSALHQPIRKTEAFPATVIGQSEGATQWMLDFGQNAAAMLSVTLPPAATEAGIDWLGATGSADTPCTYRFAFSELLGPGGGLGPNLNVGDVVFTATAGWLARNTVQFVPDFSYGGFRYSNLTFSCGGSTGDIVAAAVAAAVNPTVVPGSIVSHFTHTDLGSAGSVDFNLELLNRIQRMTRYTSFSNLMDVPTDCPTRERAGWTGDGQLTSPVVSYNFDAGAFYRKWLRDIGDAQRFFRSECMGNGPPPDDCDCKFDDCTGEIPPAAPWYRHGYHGGKSKGRKSGNVTMPGTDPAWGMAFTVIAHHMLDWYGDLRAVEEQYAGLVLYMRYLRNIPGVIPVVAPFNESGLLTYNVYSDWDKPSGMHSNPPVPTSPIVPLPGGGPRGVPSPLIGSWSYITQLRQMTEIAEALGHNDDAARFAADAARSSTAFVAAYFRGVGTPGATFGDGSLTQMSANALALDLFPESDAKFAAGLTAGQREATVNALVRAVIAAGNHSDAGIISFSTLYPVMSSVAAPNGSALPGTLAVAINVKQDYPSFGYELARNATTLWEKFEGTAGTHNHIMFGTQSAWYFRNLAGIQRRRVDRTTFKGSAWASLRLKPAVSCEYLRPDLNLTRVNASLDTPAGRIVSSWQLWQCPTVPRPPTPGPTPGVNATCALVLEKDKYQTNTTGIAVLGCGHGEIIDRVTFADFGTPAGSCSAGFTPGNCSDPTAAAKVASLCVGNQSCMIPVNVHTFGDPCLATPKRLAVEIRCRGAPSSLSPLPPTRLPVGPRKFTWDISIPTAATAVVELPLLAAAPDKVSVIVDGRSIWEKGAFVPGAPGVSAGAAQNGTLVLTVGSGDYSFILEDA